MKHKVAILVGSLRKESWNKKIALALMEIASQTLAMEIVDISQLPLYNEDLDLENIPAAWTTFRKKMQEFDAVLFVTPEYNRSVPAVLKNAIDVGSRPYGKSIWDGKPASVISASIGIIGGFGANHHLRQSLVFLNMPCLQQPEVYLGTVGNLFGNDGKITASTQDFLTKYVALFSSWIATNIKNKAIA